MKLDRLNVIMLILLIGVTFCRVDTAFSQATSGTILGRITDPQEATVPQAAVSAKNRDTGLTQTAETNDNGDYILANLPPGTYTITVTKDGFTTAVSDDNRLVIDQKLRLDIRMALGNVTDKVTVTAETPLLQTQNTETSQVVETKRITDLPLLGRNFLDLTRLATGVTSGQGGNNTNISVNGQREFANSIVVDGIEVSANRNNDTSLRPSVDSVQEFKIQTSAYAPEYGKASGAVVTIQTKSGSNAFHGSVYEFFRPGATAARPFNFTSAAQDAPKLRQHNFGATIGGPIFKDRTFFFASYEGLRQRNSFTFPDSVPPIDQIRFLPNGDVDLSGLIDPITGNQIPIFDPEFYAVNFFAEQFPGNIIPANRVSPAGRAILLNFFPKPTLPGILNGYFSNFPVQQPFEFNSNTVDARIDHTFSERDRLAGVYHYAPFNSVLGDRFAGIPVTGGGSADIADDQDSRNQSLSITETHLFSNTLINEFRFGYTRFRFDQRDLITDQNVAEQFGVGNINLPGFPQTTGFPQIFLGTGYQTGGSTFKPLFFLDSNYQFTDNVTKQINSHSLKAGLEFRFLSAKPTFSLFPTSFMFFGGAFSSLTGDPNFAFFDPNAFYGNGGSDIADLLLGLPLSVNTGLQLTDPRTKSHETNFYFQDSWQVNKRLVLNYGLRYEYQSPYREVDDNASNFDPQTLQILLAGRGGNSSTLIEPDKNNFMPRIGIAYRVTDHTVLRTGYGIFYSPENDARSDVLTKNFPFATRDDFFNDIFGGLPFRYNLDTGIPRVTTIQIPDGASSIDALSIPGASSQALFFVDPHFRTGYSQLFNFVLQQELASNFTVDVGYVGSLSRKLPYAVGNLNRGGRISPLLGSIDSQFSIGNGNYHSLQIKADKRFSRGTSFFVAYTFGKNIDDGPAPFNLGRNNQQPQDPFNLALERAVSANDIRHNFVASFIYELPFGREKQFLGGSGSVTDIILGGWQINGIVSARSGLPVNVVRNAPTGFQGLRPDVLRDPELSDPTLDRYFDTAAFSVTGLVNTTIPGTAGRNIVRGPGFANLDFSLFKNFSLSRLREGAEFELRFEFFNLTNTPHFANPNSVFGTLDFGRITNTVGNPRIIQFAAKVNF
ncbi:MAG: TonB-dependent receptor [Blastocatellia bacterium]